MNDKKRKRVGRPSNQLPLFAKLPRGQSSSYSCLFVQSNDRTPSKELGRMDIATYGSVRGNSFTTRISLPLPRPSGDEFVVEEAALIATGPHVLGSQELRVYQAVIGLALCEAARGGDSVELTLSTNTGQYATQLRAMMGVGGTVKTRYDLIPPPIARPIMHPCVVSMRTTPNAIIDAAGLTRTQKSANTVIAALRALSAVTFTAQVRVRYKTGKVVVHEVASGMRMMLHRITTVATPGNALRHTVEVHFDPFVTEILASLAQVRYALVPLDEMRKLKGEVTVILHSRLCAVIDRGKKRRINLGTLISYVYEYGKDDPNLSGERLKHVRNTVRAALKELESAIGWKVEKLRPLSRDADELYLICRPAASRTSIEPLGFAQLARAVGDIVIPEDAESIDPGAGEVKMVERAFG